MECHAEDGQPVNRVQGCERRHHLAKGDEHRLQGKQDEDQRRQADPAAPEATAQGEQQEDQRQSAEDVAEVAMEGEVRGSGKHAQAGQEHLRHDTGEEEPRHADEGEPNGMHVGEDVTNDVLRASVRCPAPSGNVPAISSAARRPCLPRALGRSPRGVP